MNILIVDDDKAHRSLIRRALQRADIQNPLLEASNIEEARCNLLLNNPTSPTAEILLLDLNLQGVRSTALIAELRSSTFYAHTPIIVISTSQLERDIRECYDCGANTYLVKSENPNTFSLHVSQAVTFWLHQSLALPKKSA
ncbi:MAG: response regulator [Deltaproteobacteria bacterium]|nr:response regulator [Deltaproteobacteria bacterium]